jgi:hypothetical protein
MQEQGPLVHKGLQPSQKFWEQLDSVSEKKLSLGDTYIL